MIQISFIIHWHLWLTKRLGIPHFQPSWVSMLKMFLYEWYTRFQVGDTCIILVFCSCEAAAANQQLTFDTCFKFGLKFKRPHHDRSCCNSTITPHVVTSSKDRIDVELIQKLSFSQGISDNFKSTGPQQDSPFSRNTPLLHGASIQHLAAHLFQAKFQTSLYQGVV